MSPSAVQTSSPPFSETLSLKGQQWIFQSPSPQWAQKLTQVFSLSPPVAHILGLRTQTLEEAEAFLFPSLKSHLPDPVCLPDLHHALDCLEKAISHKTQIAIWGDYDVDGATSTALWVRFLRALGLQPLIYIPDRFREGYGPNTKGIQNLAQQGIQTLVMVDCGTTSFEPLEAAHACGLDVIVIDHHRAEPTHPLCTALINPKRLDALQEATPFQCLAAVGLSFFVIMALNRRLREAGFYSSSCPEPSLLSLLDLVALGTVCDVMPLTGLNRMLVAKGLQVLARRQNCGLKTLMDVAKLQEPATAYHLGFILGPRINAGGRIGESLLGTRLLISEDPSEALSLALQLDELNQQRKNIEKQLEDEAIGQAQSHSETPCLVVSGEGWHQGVIGIVASRLKERFYKPSFVIGWEGGAPTAIGKGSARSISGIDLGALIHTARLQGHLLSGGGHTMAGGFSLRKDQLQGFQDFLYHHMAPLLTHSPTPTLSLMSLLTFQALQDTFLTQLQALAPFGVENPTAVWAFHDVRVKKVSPFASHHLRLELEQFGGYTCTALAFRAIGQPLGDFLLSTPRTSFSIAATCQRSSYNGQIQLIIEDIRV